MSETRKTAAKEKSYEGFTEEERDAMKERAQELKKAAKRGSKASPADAEAEVLAKIAEMGEADRAMAERIHAIVKENAPELAPKLWYGSPAYAKGGKVVCFFQGQEKFKTRYATLGFNEAAELDEGTMWPVAFALDAITEADASRIAELVKRAAG